MSVCSTLDDTRLIDLVIVVTTDLSIVKVHFPLCNMSSVG